MRTLTRLMVTGGAGFIGSNFIRHLLSLPEFRGRILNVDKLTYAGNLENLIDVDARFGARRYRFERADICDYQAISRLIEGHGIDTLVHFAAESHVDRSILEPGEFVQSNIVGTFTLLEAARRHWKQRADVLFHHVSTDEVFGSLGPTGKFTERTPYDPRSPYSASKAAADHLVRAYHHTYGLPITLSNCSNNFGPCQFPEKLMPLMILNLLEDRPLPVYGRGEHVRDWLHVRAHSAAIWLILNSGAAGATYNVGGECEWTNIDLVRLLCERVAAVRGVPAARLEGLISFVEDRPGHDQRYAIDCARIRNELGWPPYASFSEDLDRTIQWYAANLGGWVDRVRSGEYRSWFARHYGKR